MFIIFNGGGGDGVVRSFVCNWKHQKEIIYNLNSKEFNLMLFLQYYSLNYCV